MATKPRKPGPASPASNAAADPGAGVDAARARRDQEHATLEQLRAEHAAKSATHEKDIARGEDTDAQETELQRLARDVKRSEIRLAAREQELADAVAQQEAAESDQLQAEKAEIRTALEQDAAEFEAAWRQAAAIAGRARRRVNRAREIDQACPARTREVDLSRGDLLREFLRLVAPSVVGVSTSIGIEDVMARESQTWLFHPLYRPFGPDDDDWRAEQTRKRIEQEAKAARPPEAQRPAGPVHIVRPFEPRQVGTVQPSPRVQ